VSGTFESDELRQTTSLRFLLETAEALGIERSACPERTGIAEDQISDPEFKQTLSQEVIATENLVALSPQKAGLGRAVAWPARQVPSSPNSR